MKSSMSPAVPPAPVAREGEDRSQDRQRLAVAVARIFDAAVDAYPKAGALAESMGVSETVLSDMRHGRRGLPAWCLLPLLEHGPSRDALLNGLRRYSSGAVSKRDVERRVIAVLRSMDARDEVLERAAEDMGLDTEAVTAVLDGDTQPIRLDGGSR